MKSRSGDAATGSDSRSRPVSLTHGLSARQFSWAKPQVWGLVLLFIGCAGLSASGLVGQLVYQNVIYLPQQISSSIYPDIYPMEYYERAFLLWSLWPASIFLLLGLFLISLKWIPERISLPLIRNPWLVTLWAIGALGIVFRLRAWGSERSLWLDEVLLATNIRDRDTAELLAQSLSNSQSAPPGFLVLTDLGTSVWGLSELGLRALPMLAGIGSMAIAVAVGQRLFTYRPAQLAFVSLLAFSPVLIYYSQEFKQYSLDVLATLVVLLMWVRRDQWAPHWTYGLVGLLLVQFSITAVFSLLALGISMTIEWILRYRLIVDVGHELRRKLKVFLLWLVGGVLHGTYLLTAPPNNATMRPFWESGGGFPPHSGAAETVEWFGTQISQLVWLGFGHQGMAPPLLGGPAYFVIPALAVLGLGALFSLRKNFLVFVLLGIGLAGASAGLYPFSSRLNLYLIPVVAVVFAAAVELVARIPSWSFRFASTITVSALILWPVATSLAEFARPNDSKDLAWLINEVESRSLPDHIAITTDEFVYSWYRPEGAERGASYIELSEVLGSPERFFETQIWLFSTSPLSSAEIKERLGDSHAVTCQSNIDESVLVLLTPHGDQSAIKTDCAFSVPKA